MMSSVSGKHIHVYKNGNNLRQTTCFRFRQAAVIYLNHPVSSYPFRLNVLSRDPMN